MNHKINNISRSEIILPPFKVAHHQEEYDEDSFDTLLNMQDHHFWYRGRHKFLLKIVNRYLPKSEHGYSAVDLGGGVGGWINYLNKHRYGDFSTLALADSSLVALKLAESVLPVMAKRYQIDLMNLHMHEEWDAAFLLDVIEHIPDDLHVLQETYKALKPGGYLFVTTPAFQSFWSFNDDIAKHLRRYNKSDFVRLGKDSGFTLCESRYFMFFLSPIYLLSRMIVRTSTMTSAQQKILMAKQHKVPAAPINETLSAIFSLESFFERWVKFPWGTSILGVFKKI